MCDICSKWESREITAKDAMAQIGVALQSVKGKASDHLMDLSSAILDQEVPMSERNVEADKNWWNTHHPTEE